MIPSLPSKVTLPLIVTVSAAVLVGCQLNDDTTGPNNSAAESVASGSSQSAAAPTTDQGLPFDARPEPATDRNGWEECPYLETAWVETTNGQRVTGVGVDPRFDTPACVYWSYPEAPQLQVLVRHMPSEDEATAVVDHYTPIDITDPADSPAGWMGGRAGGGVIPDTEGAVYAVSKGNVAVVVLTNQEQSLKAELIAEETITNLGL